MSIFDTVSALFSGERKLEEQQRREDELRRMFKARCGQFKALLSANKRALYSMAALEDALKGDRHFGMHFVRANCTTIVANVFNMVRHLNELSGNAYAPLFDRLKAIGQNVSDITSPKSYARSGPMVLPLEAVNLSLIDEAGGKMASLGEIRRRLGLNIPKGFVITAGGCRSFIDHNNLQEEINRRIQITDLAQLDAVFALSSSIQQLIIAAPVPEDLAAQIMDQFHALAAGRPGLHVAVRSSAIGEDAHGASFAGQYRSELNVDEDMLLDTFKEVLASKYSVTAMSYRINRGIPDDEAPMCVGCLEMVDAVAGGVVYSVDPLRPGSGPVIYAVPGLPKAVVDGSAAMDVFRVSRQLPHAVVERAVAHKTFKLQSAGREGIVRKPLSPEEGAAPCLSDEAALEIARIALALEVFHDMPQDVEWALDPDGAVVILQSRPLPGLAETAERAPLPDSATVLLEGGVSAATGVGAGEIRLVRRNADMLAFPRGAVLLVEQAHARWAPVLDRAAAVISQYGGTAGHLASVAREYGVPALFGLPGAVDALKDAGLVTVDADACRVLAGKVEALLAQRPKPLAGFRGSPVHALLDKAARLIVPLNLLNPESPDFTPANCRTLHDITRFCHEKAVEEMFRMEGLDDALFSSRLGKQLKYKGSKLQYFVVNMENGFTRDVPGRYIDFEHIACRPMLALWHGMIAIPWAGPGTSARGFLSLVAESAGNPELEITSASTRMVRNYFMVDRDYCNLQASFGYHFCTVEAQAGEEPQENYVNFHFKGGAANMSKRLMRVTAIADVLAENGFLVDVKEDALSARAEDIPAEDTLELLMILGYLLIHTRQMDAGMHGEDTRLAFADSLRAGIRQVLASAPELV